MGNITQYSTGNFIALDVYIEVKNTINTPKRRKEIIKILISKEIRKQNRRSTQKLIL